MHDTTAVERLLTALREHETGLSKDDVLWAFESVKTRDEATAWVEEYINQPTLLSKEELELYRKLERKGAFHSDQTDTFTIRPFHDDELSTAITALQNSTAAIDRQCRDLEVQKEALQALIDSSKPDPNVERALENRRQRQAKEKSQLNYDTEGITQSLIEQLAAAQKESKSAVNSLISAATDRLASDDRRLAALSRLPSISEGENGGVTDASSVEKLCHALISFRTVEIKSRIELIYRTSLLKAKNGEVKLEPGEELVSEKEALQGELDTLHSEIASVAEMVVGHELREPLLRTYKRSESRKKQTQLAWLDYISSTLRYMVERLRTMSQHAQDLSALREALDDIDSALRSLAPPPRQAPSKRASMAKRISVSTPIKLPPTPIAQPPPVVTSLLRHMDIPCSSSESAIKALDAALQTRSAHLQNQHAVTASALTSTLGSALSASDTELQALTDALFEYSDFKSVSLSSQPLKKRLEKLGAAIGEVSREMAGLDGNIAEQAEVEVARKLMERFPDA